MLLPPLGAFLGALLAGSPKQRAVYLLFWCNNAQNTFLVAVLQNCWQHRWYFTSVQASAITTPWMLRKLIPWFYVLKCYIGLLFKFLKHTLCVLGKVLAGATLFSSSLPLLQNCNENCRNLCFMSKTFSSSMEAGAQVAGKQSNWYCGTQIPFLHSFWESCSCRKVTTDEKRYGKLYIHIPQAEFNPSLM